jgi:hypothetical protein
MQRDLIPNQSQTIRKVIHRQISKMTKQRETPNFASWQHDTLAEFATEVYTRLQDEQAATEQLRLDLKDAMKLARIQNMKDNKA